MRRRCVKRKIWVRQLPYGDGSIGRRRRDPFVSDIRSAGVLSAQGVRRRPPNGESCALDRLFGRSTRSPNVGFVLNRATAG
jgi:hypothetical protein